MSMSIKSKHHPPLEYSSDESETFFYASSDSSMNASILEKLAEYIYDDEDDANVLRRVMYTGICAAFPRSPGGECGPVIPRQEMIKVDKENPFLCLACHCHGPYKPLDSIVEQNSIIQKKDKKKKKTKRSKSRYIEQQLESIDNNKDSRKKKTKKSKSRSNEQLEVIHNKKSSSTDKRSMKENAKSSSTTKKKKKNLPTSVVQLQKRSSNNKRTPAPAKPITTTQEQLFDESNILSPHGKSELSNLDGPIEIRTSRLYEEELLKKSYLGSSPLFDKTDYGKKSGKFSMVRNFMMKSKKSHQSSSSQRRRNEIRIKTNQKLAQ